MASVEGKFLKRNEEREKMEGCDRAKTKNGIKSRQEEFFTLKSRKTRARGRKRNWLLVYGKCMRYEKKEHLLHLRKGKIRELGPE